MDNVTFNDNSRKQWTHKEIDILCRYFPYVSNMEIQKMLPNRTIVAIQTMSKRLGLYKDKEHSLKMKRQNSLKQSERLSHTTSSLPYFFQKYKKSLNGENISGYKAYSFMKKEWVVLLFKHYLRSNNISYDRDFWLNLVVGQFLQQAKLKTTVKKCFNGYYDFLTYCFPHYHFKEWEFKYLNVSDGFWEEEYNRFHCIREGIVKMKNEGLIEKDYECLELPHNVLSLYTSSSLITYKGKHCIVDYLNRHNVKQNEKLYWNGIRFDSYEEKRLFLHIENNYSVIMQKCEKRKHLFHNSKDRENYIPDFIISTVNNHLLDKPIIVEYFGLFKNDPKNNLI